MYCISSWERLADALARVMTAGGLSRTEAQTNICRAIEDGAINFRAELGTYLHGGNSGGKILESTAFKITKPLKPEDFDWGRSGPLEPWLVLREAFRRPGHWFLNWFELRRDDVTSALCCAEAVSSSTPSTSDVQRRVAGSDQALPVAPRQAQALGSERRRGRRPLKFERTKKAMREELERGVRSISDLKNMLEKELSAAYRVSRDTARKARNAVLQEFNSLQIPTNDK